MTIGHAPVMGTLSCFHGGAFWDAVGPGFENIAGMGETVNADVLDAWFAPSPAVVRRLGEIQGWAARTSPPTHAEGLRRAIAVARGLEDDYVLAGPGSSALIYLAFRKWLHPGARVVVPEPSYGEYAHLAEKAGAVVVRVPAREVDGFALDLGAWCEAASTADVAVLVNPNNPTGYALMPSQVAQALARLPDRVTVWVDEAYVDYLGPGTSVESLTAKHRNLVVVKSLSKGFALSGLRAAYLVADPERLCELARWVPPWWVSLPAQVAAVAALSEPSYYDARYAETAVLRGELASALAPWAERVVTGPANWLLLKVGSASELVRASARRGVFLRDCGPSCPSLDDAWVRVAVKDRPDHERIVRAVAGWR